MSTITNLGFEMGSLGDAASWTRTELTQFEEFAQLGNDTWDGFEYGWTNDGYILAWNPIWPPAAFSSAIYVAAPPFEDFEKGWANFPYLTTSFSEIAAIFVNTFTHEDFEAGWGNDAYVYDYTGGGLSAALFVSGNAFEDFETGWENDTYEFAFIGGDVTAANFNGANPQAFDDFEFVKAPQPYLATGGANTFTTTAHGLSVNYRVVFQLSIGGLMPEPVAPDLPYYVQNVVDADNFNIALTPSAGAPLDITTNGSGLLTWTDPYEFWTTILP